MTKRRLILTIYEPRLRWMGLITSSRYRLERRYSGIHPGITICEPIAEGWTAPSTYREYELIDVTPQPRDPGKPST